MQILTRIKISWSSLSGCRLIRGGVIFVPVFWLVFIFCLQSTQKQEITAPYSEMDSPLNLIGKNDLRLPFRGCVEVGF